MKAAGRILLIGLVVLSIGAISVWALGAGAGRSILGRHHGDGICDSQGSNCRYEDADNDGVCDSQGSNCRYGKYQAFLELQALDPSVTVQEVREMSMKEIRTLLDRLSGGEDPETGGAHSHGGHGSGGSGQGHGTGAGG